MWTARIGGGATRIDIRGQLAGGFLGTAGGVGFNVLGSDVGYRSLAAALAVGAVITGTNWLWHLPSRTPSSRNVPPVLLGLAVVAAVATVVVPTTAWAGPVILTAVGLVAAAAVILVDLATVSRLLFGAAFIGFGVAAIGSGATTLREGDLLTGRALLGGGVAVAGIDIARLRESNLLFGVADIATGTALIALGVAALRERNVLLGVAFAGFGLAFIGAGVAVLRESDVLFGVTVIGLGAAAVGIGGGDSLRERPLVGRGADRRRHGGHRYRYRYRYRYREAARK